MDHGVDGLSGEGFVVQVVSEDTDGEDDDSEEVAAIVRGAEDFCQEVCAIF